MAYRIVNATTLTDLEKNVTKLMDIGFVPVGSFKANGKINFHGTNYYQAMYK
ncbi:hypothetical protein IMCC3317_35010 [Kordia antarctica]|uniref:Uncharacterized protein n=1 Tax=Kordia antarctica TaxID=1218801 RepID=A0A7L4ZNC5_9FLAO|nr:hypothetical protein [Kordia antarctica]QHI38115.1 hypothetical protein IMCC3317_35010 [Kordia antarctica]